MSALNVQEYKQDLERLINIRQRQNGCWVGAVNCHGSDATKYMQFTVWHITETEVYVLYPNFQKYNV